MENTASSEGLVHLGPLAPELHLNLQVLFFSGVCNKALYSQEILM